MSGVNQIMIVGNVGSAPELNYGQNSVPFCRFSVAVNEQWKTDGVKKEKVTWFSVIAFNALAETCANFIDRGRLVAIQGRVQTREYDDQAGTKHQVMQVVDSKRAMLRAASHEVPRESVEQVGDRMIDKATPVELGRLMVCMAIADELMVSTYGSGKAETMLKFADAYGIDVKQVRDGPKNGPARQSGAKELKKRKKTRAAA